jgi:hypothetical protein
MGAERGYNLPVLSRLELRNLSLYRLQLRGEQLQKLRFKEALQQCLELMELSFNMVEVMASRDELKRIQNGCAAVRDSRDARKQRHYSRKQSSKSR